MDAWLTPAMANGIGVVGVVFLVGMLIMRGHLIPGKWHREALATAHGLAARAEERAERWESIALKALDATERLAEPVGVAAKVLTTLPNPSQEG
jgi:hypothetical protein